MAGTGGTGLRSQVRCTPTSSTAPFPSLNTSDPSCPIWASIYTTNQGAQVRRPVHHLQRRRQPPKARAYFKNINNNVIDSYTIFAD